MVSLLLSLIALVAVCSVLFVEFVKSDGYDQGNWEVAKWEIGTQLSPDIAFAPFHIYVWAPTKCFITCGSFKGSENPVLIFISSFAGQVSVKLFDEILSGVAAHGIVVVGVDQKPLGLGGSFDYNDLSASLEMVEKYVRGESTRKLADDMSAAGAMQKPKITKFFIGGHSSGNHIAVRRIVTIGTALGNCDRYGGVVMLSPVDGEDPFGLNKDLIISSRKKMSFITPGVIVSGELDSVASDTTKGLACAPDSLANDHFYNAWRGEIFSIEVSNIGHLDVLDKGSFTSFDSFCKTQASDDEKAKYRVAVKGSIVSFIDGIVSSRATALSSLSSATDLKVKAVTKKKEGESNGGTFQCTWDVPPEPLKYEVEVGIYLGIACCLTVFFGGVCIYIRRMDKDNREDWIVKVEQTPLTTGDSYSNTPGSFNIGTPSLKRDIYDNNDVNI